MVVLINLECHINKISNIVSINQLRNKHYKIKIKSFEKISYQVQKLLDNYYFFNWNILENFS